MERGKENLNKTCGLKSNKQNRVLITVAGLTGRPVLFTEPINRSRINIRKNKNNNKRNNRVFSEREE